MFAKIIPFLVEYMVKKGQTKPKISNIIQHLDVYFQILMTHDQAFKNNNSNICSLD